MSFLHVRLALTAVCLLAGTRVIAAPVALAVSTSNNGLYDIYSVPFDGPLVACGSGSSNYCTFFGGDPASADRAINQAPVPSGLVAMTPGGIGPDDIPVAPTPLPGSFLDLTLNSGNTQLTLGTSSITFAPLSLCMGEPSCSSLNVSAVGAGMVLGPPGAPNPGPLTPAGGGSTGATVAVDANGRAVFQVQTGNFVNVDFSRLSQVVTTCTGSMCALVTFDVLSFDMVRYVLEIDYDPTFTSFTGKFIGQTPNNSLLFANLDSVAIPVPATAWLLGPAFGLLGMFRRKRAR
ncbi:MAG: hypothetical protein JNK40_03435 [Chromatiales bacterium]|nr:hypothetical protein [Chromatiales bacterium]